MPEPLETSSEDCAVVAGAGAGFAVGSRPIRKGHGGVGRGRRGRLGETWRDCYHTASITSRFMAQSVVIGIGSAVMLQRRVRAPLCVYARLGAFAPPRRPHPQFAAASAVV